MPQIPSGVGYDIPCGACVAPREIPARSVIAAKDEPGQRLVITGRIFEGDGVTPTPGITLWLSHADALGRYAPEGSETPRLQGWVRSGPDGRYEIETIRPGIRPDRKEQPVKIYAHLFGPRHPERFIPEYRFVDDPLLAPAEKELAKLGRFSPIVDLRRGTDGVWRGARDIRIEISQAEMIARVMALARSETLDPAGAAAILKCRVGMTRRIHEYRRETPLHRCPGLDDVKVLAGGEWVAVSIQVAAWMELALSDFDALVEGYPFMTSDSAEGFSHLFRTPAGMLAFAAADDRVTAIILSNEPPAELERSKSLRQLRKLRNPIDPH